LKVSFLSWKKLFDVSVFGQLQADQMMYAVHVTSIVPKNKYAYISSLEDTLNIDQKVEVDVKILDTKTAIYQ